MTEYDDILKKVEELRTQVDNYQESIRLRKLTATWAWLWLTKDCRLYRVDNLLGEFDKLKFNLSPEQVETLADSYSDGAIEDYSCISNIHDKLNPIVLVCWTGNRERAASFGNSENNKICYFVAKPRVVAEI